MEESEVGRCSTRPRSSSCTSLAKVPGENEPEVMGSGFRADKVAIQ